MVTSIDLSVLKCGLSASNEQRAVSICHEVSFPGEVEMGLLLRDRKMNYAYVLKGFGKCIVFIIADGERGEGELD
jgi:hypothetical protein